MLARLDHPGIVALLDRGHLPDGRPFLVMRIAVGPDIAKLRRAAVDPASRLRLARKLRGVVAAVAHAHAQRVVHRDLKPSNVRIADDGAVSVLDWGLAAVLTEASPVPVGAGLTQAGARIGTPAYMSPEQAAGEPVGPAADVWSLGVMLWEVLAGRRAYRSRASTEVLAGVLSGPPPPLARVAPDTPVAVAAVVGRALSPLSDRYADAGAFLAALDVALDPVVPPPPVPPRRWGPVAATVLGASLVGLAAVAVVRRPDVDPAPPVVDWTSKEALITALLRLGDEAGARRLALQVLAEVPTNAIARGAILATPPQLQPLWSLPFERCAIGEALRWDGRVLACAQAGRILVYGADRSGARLLWSRPEEFHQVGFVGQDQVFAQAPARATPARLSVSTGEASPYVRTGPTLGAVQESRNPLVTVILSQAVRERKQQAGAVSAWGSTQTAVDPQDPIKQVIVRTDGREVQVRGTSVVLTDPSGEVVEGRWEVPAERGRPRRLGMGATEHFVLVITHTGDAARLDLSTGEWSPWLETGAAGVQVASLSPSGERAALSWLGHVLVWTLDADEHRLALPEIAASGVLLDENSLVVVGLEGLSGWELPPRFSESHLQIVPELNGLVWSAAGLLGWGVGGAVMVDLEGEVRTPAGQVLDAKVSGDGRRTAVARGEAGVEVWDEQGGVHAFASPPCAFVAWAAANELVCITATGGPHRLDLATGAVDERHTIPWHRWHDAESVLGNVVLMDWDTRYYSYTRDGLQRLTEAPWATAAGLTADGEGLLLNGQTGLVRRMWRQPAGETEDTLIIPMSFRATDFVVSPDGRWVAAAFPMGGISIADTATGVEHVRVEAGMDRYSALAWSPDGRQLAVGNRGGSVEILDLVSVLDLRDEEAARR